MIERLSSNISPRSDWSQILAYAWTQTEQSKVLEDLRKDPKGTIIELAKASSKYPNVDDDTKSASKSIQEQAEQSPSEGYSGYLPIPDAPGKLAELSPKDLEVLIRNGITGILQFESQAKIWSEILHSAWNDPDRQLLNNIRKDPLTYLPRKDELLQDKYGIFPLPDRPRGLDKLTIDDLEDFFDDEDNVSHLSGIFLIGS